MKAFDRFQMEQLDEPLQGGGGTEDTNQDQDQDQQQETDRIEGGGGSGDAVETVSLDDRRIQTRFLITTEQPVVGQQAQALFEITNNADQRLRVRDTFTVDGSAIGSVDTVLTPSETVQRTPTFTVPDATEIALSARSLDSENTARTIPAVSIASIDAQPLRPTAGDQVMVTVGVENRTRSQATQALTVRVDGTSTQGTTVTIPAGGTVRKQFTHTFQQAGEHTISVNKATATIQVQAKPQEQPETEQPDQEPRDDGTEQPEEPRDDRRQRPEPKREEAGLQEALVAGVGVVAILIFILAQG